MYAYTILQYFLKDDTSFLTPLMTPQFFLS